MYNNNNRHAFYLGYKGYSNSLTVSDGGQVLVGSTNANRFVVGWYQASASNNMLTVTGTNSLLSMTCDLSVGYASPGNQMTISNGGVVSNFSGYIGYGAGQSADVNASNNSVLVTGAGALWNNGGNLCIGYGSTDSANNNQMTVSNGGIVSNVTGYIGYTALAANNAATVTGAGALWNNSGDLNVGYQGSGNSLTIANGGVVANVNGWVGYATAASNNTVTVTGANSLWNNSGTLYVGNGTNANNSQLTISNGGQVNNTKGDIGYDGANNTVLVTGANSLWQNSDILVIGDHTAGNALTIANGGVVSNLAGYVGYGGSASNNTVTVSGSGAVWNNNGVLTVGLSGSGNQLTISNSGRVVGNTDAYVGNNAGANNNTVLVTGSGSVWTNSGILYIGYDANSANNSLVISNGATASVGNYPRLGGNNNSLVVAGTGSVFTAGEILVTGNNGYVTLTGGARIYSTETNSLLGDNLQGSHNTILITGSGSVWSNSGRFSFGVSASYNQLTISNGGALYDNYARIARNSQGYNTITVTDPGSLWNTTTGMELGYNGISDTLTISNAGAVVVGGTATIGGGSGSGSKITVAGGSLAVTNAGATGTLDVLKGTLAINGGTVTVNAFLATNGANSVVQFNGGLLNTGGTTVSNGVVFTVGNGASAAMLNLQGGTHSFANGLAISANAQLSGTGTITGGTVQNAGTLSLAGGQTLVFSGVTFTNTATAVLLNNGGTLLFNAASFYNDSTNNVAWNFGTGSTVVFSNGVNWLSGASLNSGAAYTSTNHNFFLPTLNLASGGQLNLVTNATGHVALYVGTLTLASGTTFNLSGVDVYYSTLNTNGATVNRGGGALIAMGAPAQLQGVVQDVYQTGLAGISICVDAPCTTSAGDGSFVEDTAVGQRQLVVDGTGVGYELLAQPIELAPGTNTLANPIYLVAVPAGTPAIPVVGGTPVLLTNGNVAGVSVQLAADTVKNADGTAYTGTLSLLPVPVTNTVMSLPGGVKPDKIVSIQVGEAQLTSPGTLTIAGTGGYAPGTVTELWRFDQFKLHYAITGEVAVGASQRATTTGGIVDDGWYFVTPLTQQAVFNWGDLAFTTGDTYQSPGPVWSVGGSQQGGVWTNTSWFVSAATGPNLGSLFMTVDRSLISTDLTLNLVVSNSTGASMFMDLLTTNGVVVTNNLVGNLLAGSAGTNQLVVDVPLAAYPSAAIIELQRGIGAITVYQTTLCVITNCPLTAVLTVLASPGNGGTVSGGGTYPIGANVPIAASATNNWNFTGWNDGNTQTSRTVNVTAGGATYTANFSEQTAIITVQANPSDGGTVTGGGTYTIGSTQTITATASNGWTFSNWSGGGGQSHTITVPTTNITYTANFATCTYAFAVASTNVAASAGSGSVGLTTLVGCTWTAVSSTNWIQTTSTGPGSGPVSYTFDANPAGTARSGTITVGTTTFTVTQAAATCTYAFAVASTNVAASAGSGSVGLTTLAGCAWTAVSSTNWIQTTSTGPGSGPVSYTFDANPAGTARSGTITGAQRRLR